MANHPSALVRAIRDGDLPAVSAALARGADPTEVLAQCRTADLARAILAAGASADYPPDDPPIVVLAQAGHAEPLSVVLDAGADVEASRRFTETRALMMAAHHGHVEAVRILLAAGASVDARDLAGATALHHAIGDPIRNPTEDPRDRLAIVHHLLGAGADRTLRKRTGETALDLARAAQLADVVALLSAGD